jgi:hypothetical protein
MRTIVLSALLIVGAVAPSHAQAKSDDPRAVMILNRMADNIGALRACSFHLEASHDAFDPDVDALVKLQSAHEVMMVGPNKLLVNSTGDGGHRGFWFDGKDAYYYSYGENNYGHITGPATIIDVIDQVHDDYGVDFPAADFFYPTFVDDLIAQTQRIVYRKTVEVDGRECFHIVATGTDQDLEMWISNDAMTLPVKYLFRTRDPGQTTEYEGTFSDWKMNPELPATIFTFTPPPGAREVHLLARNEKSNSKPSEKPKSGGKKK